MKQMSAFREVKFSGPRIVLDERDLRSVLACGYLAPPNHAASARLRSADVTAEAWPVLKIVDGGVEIPFDKPCILEFAAEVPVKQKSLAGFLPASSIVRVFFESTARLEDFRKRTSVMRGLPVSNLNLELDEAVQFRTNPESAESAASDADEETEVDSALSEAERSAGAVCAVLAANGLPRAALEALGGRKKTDRATVVDVLMATCGMEGKEAAIISAMLDELAGDRWAEGFDPADLVKPLASAMTKAGLDKGQAERWAVATRRILKGDVAVGPGLVSDDRDVLLRGTLLALRTVPFRVDRVEEWRDTDPKPGTRVLAVALLLGGWYQGFAPLDRAKGRSAIYRLGCKGLVAGMRRDRVFALDLSFSRDQSDDGIQVCTLTESAETVAEVRFEPDPGLMEAYYATKQAMAAMSEVQGVTLDAEAGAFVMNVAGTRILGTRVESDTICWNAIWRLAGGPRKKQWNQQQYALLATLARESFCAVYPMQFPEVGVHVYQRLSTMDREEIVFHVTGIVRAVASLEEAGNQLKKAGPRSRAKWSPKEGGGIAIRLASLSEALEAPMRICRRWGLRAAYHRTTMVRSSSMRYDSLSERS